MSLSTHVLDAALGHPARDVRVVLSRLATDGWTRCAEGRTDADGRLRPADDAGRAVDLERGIYRLDFETAAYFTATSQVGFYPQVSVTFEVTDPAAHHHVPLLLSPFAYSTYRGS
ncbi:MAG: hydroxyisourate hydrolase [Marmoricola sp.]